MNTTDRTLYATDPTLFGPCSNCGATCNKETSDWCAACYTGWTRARGNEQHQEALAAPAAPTPTCRMCGGTGTEWTTDDTSPTCQGVRGTGCSDASTRALPRYAASLDAYSEAYWREQRRAAKAGRTPRNLGQRTYTATPTI